MATLGDASVLSMEDTCAILDLYTDRSNACKVPPSTAEAGWDEATGLPAMGIAQTCSKKGSLSSLEEDMSNDMTLLGKGVGTKPTERTPLADKDTYFTESARKRCRHTISCLT